MSIQKKFKSLDLSEILHSVKPEIVFLKKNVFFKIVQFFFFFFLQSKRKKRLSQSTNDSKENFYDVYEGKTITF